MTGKYRLLSTLVLSFATLSSPGCWRGCLGPREIVIDERDRRHDHGRERGHGRGHYRGPVPVVPTPE